MKSTLTLRFSIKRLLLLTLVSLVAVAALLGIAASANKANRGAKARQSRTANSESAINPVSTTRVGMQPAAPLAASITATLTDNVPAATKVAPGGTINYTAVITNAGAASPADDALSLVYNGTLDNNTTIVPGSVSVSTIATSDTYPQTVIGNVSINSANIPYSVVTNDYQGQNAGTPTITAFDATTTAGGQIVMTTSGVDIGKFTYNPPPGFEGTDTFTYTFTNSVGSSVGTVSIPVSGMVWFINNNAAACTTLAAGCGRLSNPFSSLAAFQALNNGAGNNPAVNDNIFVYESVTTYTGGVTLLGGQRFIGQDATASLSTITGLTPPSGSAAFPATSPGGTAVTLTNAAGAGITLNATNTSNTVRGMTITNTSGTKILGSNFGTLTAGNNASPDLVLNGTGQALSLTNGTFAATSGFGNVITTSSTGTGVSLNQVAGTVAFNGTQVSGSTTQGIFVNQSTVTVNFGNTSITGGTDGVFLQNNTGGTRTFGALTITNSNGLGFLSNTGGLTNITGATTITNPTLEGIFIGGTTAGNGVTFADVNCTQSGSTGVFLNSNAGAITFADLDISPDSGDRGFHATPTQSGVITTTSGTISTTNAIAVEILGTSAASRTPLNMQLTSVSANGAANGIFLQNTSATGSPGGFTVLGTGGSCTVATPTCTGGRIQQTAGGDGTTGGTGVRLVNANSVSLSLMRLNDHPNFALYGNNVNGFTLSSAYIHGVNGTNAAVGTDECSVSFDNLLGSASITNSDIDGGKRDNLRVVNTSGTLNRLTVSNTTIRFHDTATGNDAFHFEGFNAGTTMNLTVSGGTFRGARGDMIDALSQTGVAMDVVIRGNSFTNEQTNVVSANTPIIVQGTGTVTYDISCNKVQQVNAAGTTGTAQGHGINVAKSTAGGAFSGTIFNNTIGKPGVLSSGAGLAGAGIQLLSNGTGTHTSLVKNNVINNYGESGIRVIGNNGNSTANVTIIGNVTTEPNPTFGFAGLFVDAGAFGSDSNIFNVKVGGAGAEQNDFTAGDPFGGSDISLNRTLAGGNTVQLNLTRPPSAEPTNPVIVLQDNNTGTPAVSNSGTITLVNTTPPLPAAISEACTPPAAPEIFVTDEVAPGGVAVSTFTTTEQQQTQPVATTNNVTSRPFVSVSMAAFVALQTDTILAAVPGDNSQLAQQASDSHHAGATRNEVRASADLIIGGDSDKNDTRHFNHARSRRSQTAKASTADKQPLGPLSGEAVGPINIGTLPAGKSVTIIYQATVNTLPLARQASHQGNVIYTGGPGGGVNTTDPGPPVVNGPTVTLIDTLATWNGGTSTDWNTASNWTIPGGTPYTPGVSNPAVNDVVIPNVGAQPNISATDITIYSLSLANGRTLTINNPRVLTIGGSPGGDLTLDGIISGGNLNFGTGTHVINNAGGTGSLSSTNVATVLSGSTVTLNNNLQAGALTVNSGGSMNITNRTLSLNGSGAALAVAGGATFTIPGSTVVFNGTAAQQAAGTNYANLTINNSIGLNVTGVTLTGNASVGTLVLTSSDLDTGAFTLTQASIGDSFGVSDVVGTVKRSSGGIGLPPGVALTFGNPNNRITFTGGAPNDATVVLTKTAPATYAAAVQRNYVISHVGGAGFTSATVRLRYLDPEVTGLNTEATLNLRRLRTSDGHWVAQLPTVRDTAANWVESNAVAAADLPTQWTFSSLAPTASDGVVTGRIVAANGTPVEGAVVRLSGTQNRKLITDANGFYRFENVETNGFYTVTPARVNFSFSPSQRSFSQLGSNTEAGFTGASAGESANPLDTAEYFVRQQYVDLLGREPDEGGFNYWSDRILECGTDALCVNSRRRDVAAAFFIEQEFQRTGSFIYGLYKGSLSRRPGYAEFSADRRHVVEGPTHEATKQAFAESFVSRAEFASKYQGNNSAESFVDALLGTVSQSSGIDLSNQRANLVSRYHAGANLIQSRSFVLRDVIDNAGFRAAEYNRAFVLAEYFGYLQRDPDEGGYDFWLDVVSNRDVNNYRSMVCAFISSAEYQRRFSSIVSRNDSECGQ